MKKTFTITFLCLLLSLYVTNSFSQISKGGTPPSFMFNKGLEGIEAKTTFPENLNKIHQEDNENEKIGVVFRYGAWAPVNADITNSGTWTELPNGQRVWRLVITSPGALAIGLYFDKFYLPPGSRLFAYSSSKDYVIGAFDYSNNHDSEVFAMELIKGESVVIEYVEPLFKSKGFIDNLNASAKDEASRKKPEVRLSISTIIHAYRNVGFLYPEDENASEKGCMVGVNCSPEGNNWQNQKRGAARVGVVDGSGAGWCSGALVNNINQDCTPYFLLADHCGGTATGYMNQWVFYFNYEATASNCNSESGSAAQSITGATFRARGPESGGSDFLLLLLNQSVPDSYNVFYNGWNRNNTASSSGVSIHHPGGRVKKISTYTTALQTYTWSGGATNAHWLVYWTQTTNGHSVTAGGSSGSPIYDANRRIVGTLTGGGSFCNQLNSPDLYGKFSYHWESNGSANNRRLRPWLDPNNTVTTLDGRGICSTTPSGLNCTNAVNLTCGQTYNGTTVGQPSNVSAYSCIGWDESGPERVHVITTSSTGNITATLSNLGSNDLDVFILSACNENACVAHGDEVATYSNAPAGTYYIVVDGYSGASGSYTLNVTCSGGTVPSSCDTLKNVLASESLTYYGFQSDWGYTSGHNFYLMSAYADKYNNSGTKYIRHAWVPVAKAHAGTSSSNVVFKAWNGSGALPGTQLGTKTVAINSLTAGQWNFIDFNPPIPVTGNFFFGYQLNYGTPQDTFAVFIAQHRPQGPSTAYAYYNNAWNGFSTIFSGNLNSSLGLQPVVCTTTDINAEIRSNEIRIYPNPANTMIAIDLENFNTPIVAVSIYNVLGGVVEVLNFSDSSRKIMLNLDNYNSGLYFINVETAIGNIVNKFSVVK